MSDGYIKQISPGLLNADGDPLVFDIYAVEADHATAADEANHAVEADVATKASQDDEGNDIIETYATKAELQAETNRATGAENELALRIDPIEEIIEILTPEAYATKEELQAETNRAIGAENDLVARIDPIEGIIETLPETYATKTELQAEIDRSTAQDTTHTNDIAQLRTDLDAEASTRASEDTAIREDIADIQGDINTINSTFLPLAGGTMTGGISFQPSGATYKTTIEYNQSNLALTISFEAL